MEKPPLTLQGPIESKVSKSGSGETKSGLEKGFEICSEKENPGKKEDFSKLSDSACCSLNESEDSGGKCQENEPNIEEESDSLECDEEEELEESELEEESVDNNTFNVINTENSESQEISELTNDDSSNCEKVKENETQYSNVAGQTSENSFDTESCALENHSEDVRDNSEASFANTRNEDDADFDDSIEEEDESSKSKRSEDQTETSEDRAMEVSPDSTDKTGSVKEEKRTEVKGPTVPNVVIHREETKQGKVNPPQILKKLPPSSNNPKSNDFKIEIFESKRKPDTFSLNDDNLQKSFLGQQKQPQENQSMTDADSLTDTSKTVCQNLQIENETDKYLESPQNSDKVLSSEPSTSTPDLTSPDSGDKTSSIMMLDVSQVIKEESEESDPLSPIRSLVEDVQPPKHTQDTSRKKPVTDPKGPTSPDPPKPPPNPISNVHPPTDELAPPVHKASNGPKAPLSEPQKPPTPMAFTIELDSAASDSSTSGTSAKKLDISGPLSQWIPKHRRNLSLTKVDEHKVVDSFFDENGNRPRERRSTISRLEKVEERQGSEKPPLGRPRSGTVGASSLGAKRGAGYHSEGYFSSDQDDDGPRRTDLKSPRSPRTPESLPSPLSLVRSNSQDSSKGNSLRMRPPSPLSPSGPYAAPLNETASFLIEKMMNATPETKRKFGSKAEVRPCCKERERKPSVSELTGKSFKTDKKMGSDGKKQVSNTPKDDMNAAKDDQDDVSEAGTYTIDKEDSPSAEEDQARNEIDGVFGVATESEPENASTTTAVPPSTTDQCREDETSWLSASEMHPPTLSRNSPNWIQQWAAHVAEQTKPPVDPLLPIPKNSSSRGHKLPMASQDSNDSRPRRKLPTLPSHIASSPSALSPRNDPAALKIRARVDKTKGRNPGFRNASFESNESGADSDFDTSTSYPFNEDERMSASLKSKLRLTGLLPASKNLSSPSAGVTSPRRPEGVTVKDPKLKNRVDIGVRDPGYDIYNPRRDDQGLHSDSSSEASEPYKDTPRSNDNNPPLKFNRAFSLRRARLGCDDPVSTQPLDKKKINRPSSAGASGASRKAPLGSTKSYQSVDSPSGIVKSPSKSSIKSTGHKKNPTRSNSTLSSKEVDFQNWKRRKNYDPMKAAAEGKKKQVEKKTKNTTLSTQSGSNNRSPSPPGSLLRSASFHGTEGVMCNMRWTRKTNNSQPLYTSEDDGPYSYEEDVGPHPSPRHGSPLHRSPTSPHQLCQSPARQLPSSRRRPSLGQSDEGETPYQASLRKISMDESGSEGKRSPLNGGPRSGAGNVASGTGRPKTKMEALDNLVISTIHSLSVKVRTTSESLLQKLKSQYDEEGDRAALLEEVLSHLSESDQSMASGQTRSTSRELAGILRNLKKIEHALEVIDRVIVVGEDDYRDEDDIDYVPTEWVEESDY